MTQLKAIIKKAHRRGESLYIEVSFEKADAPEEAFTKEYRISKAYSQEKIFAIIRKDLHLFRKHDKTASKIEKLIDKEIPL